MNFTKPSLWVRFGLPLSIFLIFITSLTGQTAQQATLLKDIQVGSASSNPENLTSLTNKVVFTADDGINGKELWASDGTQAGTTLIKDFVVGSGSPTFSSFVELGGYAYFLVTFNETPQRVELWKTGGTTSTTIRLFNFSTLAFPNFSYVISNPFTANNRVYVPYKISNGGSPNVTNTLLVTDGISSTVSNIGAITNYPDNTIVPTYYYEKGQPIFTINASPNCSTANETGSITVIDSTGIKTSVLFGTVSSAGACQTKVLGVMGRNLYFLQANTVSPTPTTKVSLFKVNTDGVKTIVIDSFSNYSRMTSASNGIRSVVSNNWLYLFYESQMWKSDGTTLGTVPITTRQFDTEPFDILTPLVDGDVVYFTDNFSRFRYWRTSNGTKPVLYSDETNPLFFVSSLKKVGNKIYSFGLDPSDVPNPLLEIKSSDGQTRFTKIAQSRQIRFTPNIGATSNALLFAFNDATQGVELGTLNLNPPVVAPCDTDRIAPILANCPQNINLTTTTTSAVATWTTPTATDNCTATPSVSSNYTSGSPFGIGTTTVTYTATDAKGNSATCSFTVNVTTNNPCATDVIPPVFSNCPTNINLTTATTTAVANWTAPTATDNCGTPSVSSNYNTGFAFPIGSTTVVYTATDAKNNTATCAFNIVVTAAQTGTPNCASHSNAPWSEWIANVTLANLNNASEKTRSDRYAVGYSDWTDKTATLTKGQSYPLSITPGLSWSGYQTNLFFRVWIDFNNNGIYEDTEKALEQNNGNQSVTQSITIPTTAITGNVRMRVSMKKDTYPTACETFAAGEVEDYMVNIQAGGVDPCATDVTPPVLSNCPANISLTTSTTTAVANWTAPTATDNCGIPSVSSNYSSGQSFSIGTTTVIYTAKDAANNMATCAFTVTVSTNTCANDVTPPQLINVPQNITVNCSNNLPTVIHPTATDNCSAVSQISIIFQEVRNGLTINRTWTATDNRGNVATATQIITISDNIAPVFIACPQDILVTTTLSSYAPTWTPPTATDNCGATPSVSSNYSVGYSFPIGTTTVVYTARDEVNNTSTCTFNVILVNQQGNVCVTPTTNILGGSGNIQISGIATNAATIQILNSSGQIVATQQVTANSVTIPNMAAGTYTVKVTILQTGGRIPAICEVIRSNVQVTNPTNTDVCKTYTASSTNSICNPATWQPYILRNSTDRYVADGLEFKETSTGTATLKGTLRSPTWAAVSVDLTFSGKTTTGTAQKINCLPPSVSTSNWAYYPTVTGTIGLPTGSVTINSLTNALQIGTGANTQNINSLGGYTKFSIGTTPFELSFSMTNETAVACDNTTDPCANDVTPPVFQTCPQNISVTTTGTSATASWAVPIVTDNCSTNISLSSNYTGGSFPIGTTTIIFTASDTKNNTATCSFNVTVSSATTCAPSVPAKIFAKDITATTAVLVWSKVNNALEYEYQLLYDDTSQPDGGALISSGIVNDTFANISLIPGRLRAIVRSRCTTNGTWSAWSNATMFNQFNEPCTQGARTAFVEDFESSSYSSPQGFNLPLCWTKLTYHAPNIYESWVDVRITSRGTLGNASKRAIMFRSTPLDSSLILMISPEIANLSAATNRLRFKAANTWGSELAGAGRVQVGTMSNIYDGSTFVPFGNPTTITDNNFREYTVDFTTYSGTNRFIAFKYLDAGGDYFRSLEIDDVVWETKPVVTTSSDIELTITSNPTTYRQWTTNTVRVTAKNIGTTTMTNIKIDLKRPAKMSFGGNRTPSVGTFNDYCAGGIECSEWLIPSLAAGATAALDAPFFVLDAVAPIVVTTNLLASTPTDANVGNNTTSVTLSPAPSALQSARYKPTQLIPVVIQTISPNPTDGELRVQLESLDAREVTFEFYNSLGKVVKSEKKAVEKGLNRLEFSIYEFEQGVYFVTPSTHQGHKVPTKFVKL